MATSIKSNIESAAALVAELDPPEHVGLRDAVMVLMMRRVFLDMGARPGMEYLAGLASITCDSVFPPSPRPRPEGPAPMLRVVPSGPAEA